MKNLIKRANFVFNNEKGASNLEIIVWMSVVLVIATTLFLFRDSVIGFIEKVIGRVDNLDVA